MVEIVTNLEILRPSRKRLQPGDVFVMKPKGQRFVWARVVRTDADALNGQIQPPTGILIYVFNLRTEDRTPPDRSLFLPSNLLIPPAMINRLGWSRGYFETIVNWPLEPREVLPRHIFGFVHGTYFDDYGNAVPEPEGRSPTTGWATSGQSTTR